MPSESEPVSNPFAMNPEVQKLWVEALRSGKYKQGAGMLHKSTSTGVQKFCCLGVLCELAIEHGVDIKTKWIPGDYGSETCVYGTGEALPPGEVRAWAGIDLEGRFGETHQERLVYLNDEVGATFPEIADVIERRM